MKRKLFILSFVLFSLMMLSCTAESPETFFDWEMEEFNNEKVVYIKGLSEEAKYEEEIVVPSKIKGKNVRFLFIESEYLKTLKIPDNLYSIEIESETLENLKLGKIINGHKESRVFLYKCPIKSIKIPASVEILEVAYCNELEDLTIPNGYLDLDIRGCEKLRTIKLGKPKDDNAECRVEVTDCPVTSLIIPEGIAYLDVSYDDELIELKLPESLIHIRAENCESLTEIAIPKNVKELGGSAFENCASLRKIKIPESVVKINYNAFFYSGIETILLDGNEESVPLECQDFKPPRVYEDTFSSELGIVSHISSWSQIINSWYKYPQEDILHREGPYVEITGTRPIKATCFICKAYKECRLLHLTNGAFTSPNGYQLFSCHNCADNKGLTWE